MQQGNFAGPIVGAPEDVAQDENMTFNYEGYATMIWGSPSTQAVEWLDRVLELESEPKLHVRGRYGTQLSKALINFVEHDLSEAKLAHICSLLGGSNIQRIIRGEPMLVDCSQATGPPATYRLGPYGYNRNKALCLIRPVRRNARFQLYHRSHTLDRPGLDQKRLEGPLHRVPLELSPEMVAYVLSDMCFDWPDGCGGLFVLQTFSLERQKLAIQRDDNPVKVAPFHATTSIRALEHEIELRYLHS